MNRSELFREMSGSLSRKLSQGPLRRHSAVRALGAVLVALGLIALISSVSGANRFRGARPASPVRPVSQPLSSYQSDLVDIPNPIDNSRNQVVTGNVASGKHFRGAVPYSSPKSIKAPLGSTSLDSFMRYTTPSDASDRISGQYNSFYSSTGTVTAIDPGRRSITTPGQSTDTSGLLNRKIDSTTTLPRLGIWSQSQGSQETPLTLGDAALEASRRLRNLPFSQALDDEKRIHSSNQFSSSAEAPLTDEAYKQQIQELQDRLGKVVAEITELEKGLKDPDVKNVELNNLSENTTTVAQETQATLDAKISRRDELLQETARLLASTHETMNHGPLTPTDKKVTPNPETDAHPRLRLYRSDETVAEDSKSITTAKANSIDSIFLPVAKVRNDSVQLSQQPEDKQIQPSSPQLDRPMGPIAVQWESPEPSESSKIQVNAIPNNSTTVSPKAPVRNQDALVAPNPVDEEKFESYLQAGQQYLNQGQFRPAADSFALAAAYKPNDPRVHLGKSHALFAVGEYASSAFFLGKAVELDTQCVLKKLDLVKMVGGADAFLARFGELVESTKTDGIPQLYFLLSYVYYQMDRPEEAKVAIERAWKKLPTSASVNTFRKAISRL